MLPLASRVFARRVGSHARRSTSVATAPKAEAVSVTLKVLSTDYDNEARASYPVSDLRSVPDMPQLTPQDAPTVVQQVGRLPNGLTVISHNTVGEGVNLGLYVRAGSALESVPGLSQMMASMFLKRTLIKSFERNVREMEQIGALLRPSVMRECMSYAGDTIRQCAPYALRIIREGTIEGSFKENEVEEAREACLKQLTNLQPDVKIHEALHYAAFDGVGLGAPLYGTARGINSITNDQLLAEVPTMFTGNNMFVCAAGLDHATLMKIADNEFGHLPAGTARSYRKSAYTGGDFRHQVESPESTHVAIAFRAPGWTEQKDVVASSLLMCLLGGGESYSEGGPGKGMHSKLYLDVLHQNPDIVSIKAFNHLNRDCSVFGISGIVLDEDHTLDLAMTIVDQLRRMPQVTDVQLARAKNTLISSILMNLESRFCLNDDTVRQYVMTGEHKSAASIVKAIQALTVDDVSRIAKQMLTTAPSVAAIGGCGRLPRYDVLAAKLREEPKKQKL